MEVGGVIGIPVEAEEGEEVADKVEEMERGQFGREQGQRSETGRPGFWKLGISTRQ